MGKNLHLHPADWYFTEGAKAFYNWAANVDRRAHS